MVVGDVLGGSAAGAAVGQLGMAVAAEKAKMQTVTEKQEESEVGTKTMWQREVEVVDRPKIENSIHNSTTP